MPTAKALMDREELQELSRDARLEGGRVNSVGAAHHGFEPLLASCFRPSSSQPPGRPPFHHLEPCQAAFVLPAQGLGFLELPLSQKVPARAA